MLERQEYEMSEEDYQKLLEASKPTPCMMIGTYTPPTPQENANRAWRALGERMGFVFQSVKPSSKGHRFFTAIPQEAPHE